MTEIEALFAPAGGWVVKIIDLSAAADDNMLEEIKGFPTLMQANEFARRYVRDSLELCRVGAATPAEIVARWMAFGEDARVAEAGEGGFNSAPEIGNWAKFKCGAEDRNWRALDPRKAADLDSE